MARRRGNRKQYASQTNWLAIIGSALLVIAVAAMAIVSGLSETDSFNEDTLCLDGQSYSAVLGVLIDSTDSFPAAPAAKTYQKVVAEVDSLPSNSLIQIYKIEGSSGQLAEPIITICKPDDGKESNPWTENPQFVRSTYTGRFLQPFQSTLKTLMNEEAASESPIIESIQAASINLFLSNADVSDKRLIIASDFLQHSNLYSMYESKPNFEDFRKSSLTSPIGLVDLDEADVSLFVIPRRVPVGDRSNLVRFWGEFLAGSNASLGSTVEPL